MKRQWSEVELDTHWILTVQELALLSGRTEHGRFGFAVLLKYFQYEGVSPSHVGKSPPRSCIICPCNWRSHSRRWIVLSGKGAQRNANESKYCHGLAFDE